jgi:serine/threonine protein kinase
VLQEQTVLPVGATIQHPDGERYVIDRLLGKGGFGAVYLVRNRHARDQLFALKEVIDPNVKDRERFLFEAEVLKRLNHRALPRVYKVFEYEKLKRVYMLMDYIEGQNLDILLAEQPEGRFPLPLVLAFMKPIIDALIFLHNQNPPIVHRDIKPSNIIVSTRGGEAVLVDFGLAKEYVEDNTTTIIRHGSPGYAAPEQYGSGTNPRTDMYGLGATFYTLLTGTTPIDAITRVTANRGIDPLVPAHLVVPSVPWATAMTIEKAMSISCDERFSSVEEFWQELNNPTSLQRMERDTPLPKSTAPPHIQTVPEQQLKPLNTPLLAPLNHTKSPFSRKRAFFGLLAIIMILAIGTTLGLLTLQRHSVPTTTRSETSSRSQTGPTHVTTSVLAFPTIGPSYAGTILDLMNNEKTSLLLTQIHQNNANITGYFQGLGMAGPFTGTVTHSGHLQFTVTVLAGTSFLFFEGDIKIGGDITGTFKALNQQKQFTGESGPWNAAPH